MKRITAIALGLLVLVGGFGQPEPQKAEEPVQAGGVDAKQMEREEAKLALERAKEEKKPAPEDAKATAKREASSGENIQIED